MFERARRSLRLRLGRRFVQLRQWRARQPPSAPPETPRDLDAAPIIVAGSHRSGTSLLRRILDTHSRIACPAEVQLLERFAPWLSDPLVEKGVAAIGFSGDAFALELGSVFDGWMRDYSTRKGKARWAEKSPGTVHHLSAVDRMFGGRALYVLVVRDGRDVAQSLGKGNWELLADKVREHGDPYVAGAHFWVEASQALLAFRAAVPDRTHLLQYEELVVRPEETLRSLFTFLGEEWEPAVLDFNAVPHDGGHEDHVVSSTWKIEDKRGKSVLIPERVRGSVEQIVAATMRELGYAV